MIDLEPIEIRSVHDEIQQRIKQYIITNHLRAGDPLPTESQLAEQLKVSRSVVREALRSLQSVGAIHSRRGEGHFVCDFNLGPIIDNLNYSMLFDTDDAREMLEIRERLETSFVADAVSAMDEETLDILRDLVKRMLAKADAGQLFLEEDVAFHRALHRKVGNRLLVKLLDVFWDVYDHLRDRSLLVVPDLKQEAQNHEAICRALEARDCDAAREMLALHYGSMERRLQVQRDPAGRCS